jgi:hypothetical protein
VYYSQASFRYDVMPSTGGTAYIVTWEPVSAEGDARTIKLEYLIPGAHWQPTYDMQIVDEDTVALAFFAEVQSSTLVLEEANVYLVAGRVDLSQQLDQVSQVTMNQYAVGYDQEVELPALGVGSVDLQHIYSLGPVSAEPGDRVYVNLMDTTLDARRLLVWNAAADQSIDVIYKVTNDGDLPLAEGIVRAYQDGLFLGSDFIETTPVGSEGSITVGSLPDLRVRRTESQEYLNPQRDDYYQHSVTLEIHNFSEGDLALVVLDHWDDRAFEFEFSREPERQPDNLLRWEVQIEAGETLTITYNYRTDA